VKDILEIRLNEKAGDNLGLIAKFETCLVDALNPLNPASGRIPDAAVVGIRTAIKF
jgi:hypothetical protein